MKKTRIISALLLFVVISAFSQSADEEIYIPTADTTKKLYFSKNTDITQNAFLDELEKVEEETANNQEVFELYGELDNTIIHEYKYKEVFQSRDSLIISLENENFILPYNGKINSHYGWRRYRPHYGTDIDLNKGDSIKAAFDGIVRYTNKKVRGYGQVIVIRHFNGLETVYAHLSKILVNTNDTIKAGNIIGLGGNTGRSTGPHLHFEVRCLGVPINSEDIIDYNNQCLKTSTFVLTKKDAEETYNLRSKKYRHLAPKGVYIVRKGDTLSKISKKTGVPLSVLMKKNKLKKTSIIRPGKKLYL